jgi:hypothetical protein
MLSKLKRKTESIGETTEVAEKFTYCTHCGRVADYSFSIGEWVMVSQPSTRAHYGRIMKIDGNYEEGPVVIVEVGAGEKETVLIDYVLKLTYKDPVKVGAE